MKELEIEIKAYCQDLAAVKNRLDELGAVYLKTEEESDRYFNHPSKDFSQTDEALRIRSVGEKTILTYKGPKISKKTKARVEKEVFVENEEETGEIFSLLGFRDSGQVVKKRDYYQVGDVIICLDDVEGLGSFVELEQKGDDLTVIEKELFALADTLGLKKFERRSYLEMLIGL